MIFGNLEHSQSYKNLLHHPVWQKAFEELSKLTPESPLGTTEFDGKKFYINVHTYDTKDVNDCRFESHEHTIDIQCTITGGELIEWSPRWLIENDGDYNPDRDFQYHLPPPSDQISRVRMTAGNFVVFYPCDAHRPKIRDEHHESVYKAVVKIDTSLLS